MTKNSALEALTLDDIKIISNKYLMGWHNLERMYGFRLAGLNRKRSEYNLQPLSKEDSLQYRINYITENYDISQIESIIYEYMSANCVDNTRWSGIELFDCRFGREYAKAFKLLLGNSKYRKLAEICRVQKLVNTQRDLYGGVGLAGQQAYEKAVQTNVRKYGVSNVMQNDIIKSNLAKQNTTIYGGVSPFCAQYVQDKAMKHKLENIHAMVDDYKKRGIIDGKLFNQSYFEMVVFYELIQRFGKDDVFYEYGLHPYDKRYPFSCDFYVKSLDLFIEINVHYSHGGHWFDDTSHDDLLRKKHLMASGKKRSINAVKTWCEKDVLKRNAAKASGIRYLVFWDGRSHKLGNERVPDLSDFYKWLIDYDCNYDEFIKDNPANTY